MSPFLSPVATGAASANNSINIAKAAVNLTNSLVANPSAKANEIRNKANSEERAIIPPPGKIEAFVNVPLIEYLLKDYDKLERGDTHVVYGRSSIGKSTACAAFVSIVAPKLECQALMITGAPKGTPYLTWMAQQLGSSEEEVLTDLVKGMQTIRPTPASILILDEMNEMGDGNCNITVVDALMRYIYTNKLGINLYIVTQDKEVADALCKLNSWQKIGPLNGLTKPTRNSVNELQETLSMDTDTVWEDGLLEWNVDRLTRLIQSDPSFKVKDKAGEEIQFQFQVDDRGAMVFVKDGMTPTQALRIATNVMEGEDKHKEEKSILAELADEFK
mmetsp:Transcript_20129/g.48125  ORF Transcript_20129/g.48125 Transcript_20129/m.48125 type:complete len:332 (-) Transcript_20129:456-1451(-)